MSLVPLMVLPSVESLAASTMTAALKEVLVATAEAGIELSLLGSFLRLMYVL